MRCVKTSSSRCCVFRNRRKKEKKKEFPEKVRSTLTRDFNFMHVCVAYETLVYLFHHILQFLCTELHRVWPSGCYILEKPWYKCMDPPMLFLFTWKIEFLVQQRKKQAYLPHHDVPKELHPMIDNIQENHWHPSLLSEGSPTVPKRSQILIWWYCTMRYIPRTTHGLDWACWTPAAAWRSS